MATIERLAPYKLTTLLERKISSESLIPLLDDPHFFRSMYPLLSIWRAGLRSPTSIIPSHSPNVWTTIWLTSNSAYARGTPDFGHSAYIQEFWSRVGTNVCASDICIGFGFVFQAQASSWNRVSFFSDGFSAIQSSHYRHSSHGIWIF